MKVLFFNPSRAGQGNIPLNIPILISLLKKNGHKVRLFDISDYEIFNDKSYEEMFFKKTVFDTKHITLDRKKFYKGEFGKTVIECRLKKSDYIKDFEQILNDFMPDIIAVSSLSVDFKFASQFLLPFKKYKIPIIFGGIHAILLPKEVLNNQVCDFVCTGEGEICFINLLDAIENNKPLDTVKGIWYKKNGHIVKNPPIPLSELTKLPPSDFECFDPLHFYRPFDGKRYKMLNYELSRGCPFNCSYCVNSVLKKKYKELGKFHRIKKIEQSISELNFLINKYHFNFIRFWDEDFTSINNSYLEEYAKIYLKEIHLPFIIYARTDTVTENKVRILKEMDCRGLSMGIESGNEFIRAKVLNRNISNKNIIDIFNLVKSYGIRVSAYNIIGLPYETREYIFETIRINRKVKPDSLSVTLLEPYKGTPIRKICEHLGLDPFHETTNNEPQFIPAGMTYDELKGLFNTFAFYIKFPKERYDEIELAEKDDKVFQRLKNEFEKMI